MGLFDKIKKLNIFSGFFSVDEDFFEELEENLILSDMGMDTTLEAVETLRERVKANKIKEPEEVKACLREILVEMLDVGATDLDLTDKPAVILMIGVNGVGKTTTIGKLANLLKNQGNRVLLAAGDTFRRRRPAGHLGRPGEGGHRPPRGGVRPRRRGVRRHERRPREKDRCGPGGHGRAPAQQAEPDERAE